MVIKWYKLMHPFVTIAMTKFVQLQNRLFSQTTKDTVLHNCDII